MDEFAWIALLRPLASSDAALGLMDDAAVLPSRPGFDLVITKDALVEGVHFLDGTSLDLVARKALRVNLSDLAAKGAAPFGYLLAVAWPQTIDENDKRKFIAGLAEDQAEFGVSLLGGDTVATSGPLTVSITAMGWVGEGAAILRSGAQVGDLVQVTGTLGDGYLGLKAVRGELSDTAADHTDFLSVRYHLPTPRLLGRLTGAHACADISDGLIADAGHIATASGVGMEIALEDLPLSPAAQAWLDGQTNRKTALLALASGGDDYELVATSPDPMPGFTVIGRVTAGRDVVALYEREPVPILRRGWVHGKDH